jgi:isoleucyl-tRNA synthetase
VLDILHRCLVAWLAPVLCFTAEEAWLARFPSEDGSVHLQAFPTVPATWSDAALAERWSGLRTMRSGMTVVLEQARGEKLIGSSLQAALTVPPDAAALLDTEGWAELAIVSQVRAGVAVGVERAGGEKCARCWRVLPEVGSAHAGLCLRCTAVVEGMPPAQAAAE